MKPRSRQRWLKPARSETDRISDLKRSASLRLRHTHVELRQVLVAARVRADTALAVAKDLRVSAVRRRVRLQPVDALLPGGRVDDLELRLRAVELQTSDSVRNETFDCGRKVVVSRAGFAAREHRKDLLR